MHGSGRITSGMHRTAAADAATTCISQRDSHRNTSTATLKTSRKSARQQPKLNLVPHSSARSAPRTQPFTQWMYEYPWMLYALPCALAVLCYLNGLPGDFLHDDVYAIETNRDVTGASPVNQVFVDDFWGRPMADPRSHKSYRPLTVLSFRLDYMLSGGDPRWFHAVNIVLHACVTAMVVLVSMRVLRATPTVTVMAAAHFAVHPIHTEAVTGIVGRADVLSALFFLLSFYFYSRCVTDNTTAVPGTSATPPTPSTGPSTPSPVRDLNFNHLNAPPSPPSPPTPPTPATSQTPSTPSLRRSTSSSPSSPATQPSAPPASASAPHSATSLKSIPFVPPHKSSKLLWPREHRPPPPPPMMPLRPCLSFVTSLSFAAAAVLCKETGVTALGVALLYDVLVCRTAIWRTLRTGQILTEVKSCLVRCCCVCVWGVVILAVRMWVMDFQQPHFKMEDNPAAVASSPLTRLLTFLYLPAFNLWLLLCPASLSYDWAVGSIPLVTSIGDPRNVYTAVAYSALLLLVWRSLRHVISEQDSSENNRDTPHGGQVRETKLSSSPSFIFTIALVFLVVPFIPASNLFFNVGFVVAERVLYIPSIGFSLLVAQGLSCVQARLPGLKLPVALTFACLLLVLGTRTVRRNQDWHSRRSLFVSGVRTLPHNAKMHYNMANLLKDEGDTPTAELHYRQAISLYPHHPSYHLNLGAILANRSEAEFCYQEALRLHPDHVGALVNLATLWIEDGNTADDGLDMLQRALNLDPHHAEALLAMGKALMDQGEAPRAGEFIQQAMVLRPGWPSAHLYHAIFLQLTDDLEAALREYRHVLDLSPDENSAMSNAARILVSQDRHSEAETLLKRALQLDPGCGDCLSILGTSYNRRGLLGKAVVTLGQACSLAPNDTSIHLKYVQALKQTSQREKALVELQKLLARVPDDLPTLTFAYNYAMEEDRLADAAQLIRDAVSVAERTDHASLSKLYYEQGEVLRLYKDYNSALTFYKKSIRRDNHQTEAIVSAGSVLYLKREYAQAEVYYLKALEQQPDHRMARHNLAKLRSFLLDK